MHTFSVNVYYEDTDAGGVVYYANYLKFAERGRTEYLKSLSCTHRELLAAYNIIFVVRSCHIDYKRPAYLDDSLLVETVLQEMRPARIIFKQAITRDNIMLAELTVEVVCINTNHQPVAIPAPVRIILKNT